MLIVQMYVQHTQKNVKIKTMTLLVETTPELGRVMSSYVYCFSAHKVIVYMSCSRDRLRFFVQVGQKTTYAQYWK